MAAVPQIVAYQGRIQSGGADFSGTGRFKFALVQNSSVTWSNSPDANADGEPDTAVDLPVSNGLFTVGLGDTSLSGMAAFVSVSPLDTLVTAPFFLRVWFNDGTNGFQRLTPDQRLDSVPFAQVAATVNNDAITAGKLADSAVTAAKIADAAVTSAKIADGTITAPDFAAGALFSLDASDGVPLDVVQVNGEGLVRVRSETAVTGLNPVVGQMQIEANASPVFDVVVESALTSARISDSLSAGDWKEVAGQPFGISIGPAADGMETVTVSSANFQAGSHVFLRLRVTMP